MSRNLNRRDVMRGTAMLGGTLAMGTFIHGGLNHLAFSSGKT